MTVTAPRTRPAPSGRRPLPATVRAALVLLGFLGVTALAGGTFMAFGLGGEEVALPADWLEGIPLVDSWVIPGIVLGAGFGIGSLVVFSGLLLRPGWGWLAFLERWTGRHWSWAGVLLVGIGHVVWIALELLFLPEPSLLQAVYGPIGLALVALPLTPSMRRFLRR